MVIACRFRTCNSERFPCLSPKWCHTCVPLGSRRRIRLASTKVRLGQSRSSFCLRDRDEFRARRCTRAGGGVGFEVNVQRARRVNVTCFAEGGYWFLRNRNSTRVRKSLPTTACPRVAATPSAEYLRTNRVRHLARGSCWCIPGRPVRSIGFRNRDADRLPLCARIVTQRRWFVSSAASSRWLGRSTWGVRHTLSADVLPITFCVPP